MHPISTITALSEDGENIIEPKRIILPLYTSDGRWKIGFTHTNTRIKSTMSCGKVTYS